MTISDNHIIKNFACKKAFTLVEVSIVLVIIGLIIGGVLVGRNLIKASQIMAQISQVEEVRTAVNTFKLKYGAIPGDMALNDALSYGFYRNNPANETGCAYGGNLAWCGDGNGIISSNTTGAPDIQGGESHLFWIDLNLANLTKYMPIIFSNNVFGHPNVADFLPPAKLEGQFLYVWAGGITGLDRKNYLTISGVDYYCHQSFGYYGINCGTKNNMAVNDAYNIDFKIDDGMPQSGKAVAMYVGQGDLTPGCGSVTWVWALWVGTSSDRCVGSPTTVATPTNSSNCYDNNNVSGQQQQYSMSQSSGNNCALSFHIP